MPHDFTDIPTYKRHGRTPDFNNLLAVLRGDEPTRPTLFEFSLGGAHVLKAFADEEAWASRDGLRHWRVMASAAANAGYDYVSVNGSEWRLQTGERTKAKSVSLNEGALITDWDSFEQYAWRNPEDYDYSALDKFASELPQGMRMIVRGPGGVLENVISLTGFDNLCYMLADQPDLVQELFDHVGSRLVRYYELSCRHEAVGAIVSNDDWGFKTQSMISPADMRKYVIPWHKRIVEAAHGHGRPAILHSCGNLSKLWDDIIDEIGYDAKHSYEDCIEPVEQAYERLQGRIAVLGGIDVDFICRRTPQEVFERSAAMLERSAGRGGYALGTGNSIPDYMPLENYVAMISAAVL